MKLLLLALLPALTGLPKLPAGHPFSVRASGAADDLMAALAADDVPLADREVWARRAFAWSFYESGFQTSALGDQGASCGVLQVQTPELWLAGATCAAVRKDRVLGYRVGIALMRHLIAKCGSVRGGLTAYATDGACHDWTPALVAYRCKRAGLTATCEAKP